MFRTPGLGALSEEVAHVTRRVDLARPGATGCAGRSESSSTSTTPVPHRASTGFPNRLLRRNGPDDVEVLAGDLPRTTGACRTPRPPTPEPGTPTVGPREVPRESYQEMSTRR